MFVRPPFSTAIALLAGVLAGVTGCQQALRPRPDVEGRASFNFIRPSPPPEKPPAAAPTAPAAFSSFEQAQPRHPLAVPAYPPVALKARAGLVTVAVRVTVDAAGNVTGVEPGFAGITTPSAFAGEFRASVAEAVFRWKFKPAMMLHVMPVQAPDGSAYLRMVSSENVETAFEVMFTFTAKGEVFPLR